MPQPPSLPITAATGKPCRADVSTSIAVNPNDPSPHTATTGRSGRAAFIPMAHGSPMPSAPIADADEVWNDEGARAGIASIAHSASSPASTVTIASGVSFDATSAIMRPG